jgi:GNAT superfamily N-acetyltransferase
MSNYTFRPLQSDSDWQEALAIRAQLHPEFPVAREEIESEDAMFSDKVLIRNVICRDNKVVGMFSFVTAFWYNEPLGFTSRVAALPDDLETFDYGFSQIITLAEEFKAAKIHSGIEDRRPSIVALAEKYGWKTKMEQKVSMVDLTNFSLEVGEIDFEIISLPELKNRRPDTWLHDYWRLDMDLLRDVPMTGEFVEDTVEVFSEFLKNPGFNWDGCFFAVMPNGDLAGTTSLAPNLVDPEIGITALTGVRREYRRRGIAKALKIKCLSWGKDQGVKSVVTDNEEKNPMYLLNEQLGFRHVFNQLAMVWERPVTDN